jgi:hypothetical protein
MVELLGLLLALLLTGLWLLLRAAWRGLRRRFTGPRLPPMALRLRRSRAAMRHEAERSATLAAEVARLRVALRLAERAPATPDDRFTRAKRAFALRFHPDRIIARGLERTVRVSLFREFWAELRRIERG